MPLVHAVTRQIQSEADIVLSLGPAEIECVGEVGAGDVLGKIGFACADRFIPTDRKLRNTAVTDTRSVGSGDVKHIQTKIRAGVGAYQREWIAADCHCTVHQKIRRKGVDPSDSSHLHQDLASTGPSAVDHAHAAGRPEAELVGYQRVHDAVFRPERGLLRLIPVDFRIHVIAVEAYRSRVEIVGDRSCKIRLGNQRLHLQDDGTLLAERNDIVRVWNAAGAIRTTGGRVVDFDIESAEISGALGIGGQRSKLGVSRALLHAFPTQEEEQLILQDRPAYRAAVVVEDILRQHGRGDVEEVPVGQTTIGMMLEHYPMELIGSALGDHVNSGAARKPLLRVETVCGDVHRLYRFRRRNIEALRR